MTFYKSANNENNINSILLRIIWLEVPESFSMLAWWSRPLPAWSIYCFDFAV